MPDLLLPRLKQEIEARLAELRPFVEEAEQLEVAKRALLEEIELPSRPRAAQPAVAAPRRARRVAADPEPAAAPTPARSDEEEAIVKVVDERPGVSIAEIVSVTKLDKATIASAVAKLKRDGVLADEAGGVKLASRQPITLAAARSQGEQGGTSDDEWDAAAPGSGDAAA